MLEMCYMLLYRGHVCNVITFNSSISDIKYHPNQVRFSSDMKNGKSISDIHLNFRFSFYWALVLWWMYKIFKLIDNEKTSDESPS